MKATPRKPKAPKRKAAAKPDGHNGTLLNADLFRLRAGLKAVGDLRGAKFAYACARNMRRVEAFCKDLQAAIAPSDAFKKYDEARDALAQEHAEKDEHGRAKTKGIEYVIADQAAFNEALETLQAEHAEAIKEQEAKLAEYTKLLEEPAEKVDFYTIPFEQLPEDISAAQLSAIFEIIAEDSGA